MSIQIVSSRIKRPPDRQCIGIGWLTSGNFQLGCLLGRLLGYEGKSKIIIIRLFSFILISRNFLLLHKLGTKFLPGFLWENFVKVHKFLPISTCCCWTWICWWPIWAATKYCWLYDIFFDSRVNFSEKFQNPNAEKSQAKRLKTQECCSGLQRLGFNWN